MTDRLFALECWIKRLYRHGPHFQRHLKNLEKSAYYTAGRLERYHNERLQRMVQHCYHHVPYYRDLFFSLNLRPEDICTKLDLQKLPFLDKQTVNENYDKLISKKHQNFLCHIGSTSGSTGTPARFLRDYNAINFENAAVWRHWRNAGDYGKTRVTLRGDIIVPSSQERPPFWKYSPANRELLMSGYHLSWQNSQAYIEKIKDFQPRVLYCYPSTGYLLAKFFKNHGERYQFDAIFTSSESLEPEVRGLMEETFGSHVYDWYGQAERVVAISQCSEGSYHIQEDYSLVELVMGGQGLELVGTHFSNFVMPLLRYRTNDYVLASGNSCVCGSAFRTVDRVLGRSYSYLLTPEGYRVSITNHIPRGVDNLLETQFYQENPGEVVLRVLTNGAFSEKDKAKLVENTLAHTSPHMQVIVKEVSDIPRGPNGKFMGIINVMESEGES